MGLTLRLAVKRPGIAGPGMTTYLGPTLCPRLQCGHLHEKLLGKWALPWTFRGHNLSQVRCPDAVMFRKRDLSGDRLYLGVFTGGAGCPQHLCEGALYTVLLPLGCLCPGRMSTTVLGTVYSLPEYHSIEPSLLLIFI